MHDNGVTTTAVGAVAAGRFAWERALRTDEELGSTDKLVGYALATWSTTSTGADARPGIARLKHATGKSDSTIWRALRRLRKTGWLEILNFEERSRRRDRAYEYQLTIPAVHNHRAPKPTGHPSPQGTDATAHRAPVQQTVGTHAHPQAQDQFKTGAAASESSIHDPSPVAPESEFDGLPPNQADAAQRLVTRLQPEVHPVDATDCVRALARRKSPPDNFVGYTRTFTADEVKENAERWRTRGTNRQSGGIDWAEAMTQARELDAAERRRQCGKCDEGGWLLSDQERAVRCKHVPEFSVTAVTVVDPGARTARSLSLPGES